MPRSSPSAARRSALALGTAALLMGPAIAGAAKEPPLVLQGSSSWNLHYDDESCQLIHTFGTGDDKVSLELHDFGPGEEFTLIAVGKRLTYSGHAAPLVTEFGPGGRAWEDSSDLVGTLPTGEGVLEAFSPFMANNFDGIIGGSPSAGWTSAKDRKPVTWDRDQEAKITQLRLAGPIARELMIELGPMDKPMDALRVCLDSLLTHWGIDAAAHHTLTRRAAPSNYPGDWATPADFDAPTLRQRKSAVVHFRVMVDDRGRATACVVQNPSRADFDKLTCQLIMKRARFTPALDAKGQPISSLYVSTVRWIVP